MHQKYAMPGFLLVSCIAATPPDSLHVTQKHSYRQTRPRTSTPVAKQNMPPSTILKEIAADKCPDKTALFINDVTRLTSENKHIPLHRTGDGRVRIATYNVHFWTDPWRIANFQKIMQVIRELNADILILQEVSYGPTEFCSLSKEQLTHRFHALGYGYSTFCKASVQYGAPFGNMILTKYPARFTSKLFEVSDPSEGRCFVHATIDLPNQKKLSVYGTHLDVWDNSDTTRTAQVQEIINLIKTDTHKNIIIAGDFNALRTKDYTYTIDKQQAWKLIQKSNHQRGIMVTPTAALDALEKAGFVDSFAKVSFLGPKFTVWTGRVIDFIFLKDDTWNLPLDGSYMYYDAASDHLPIVLDIVIGS